MKSSRWVRLMGVAVGAMAVGVASFAGAAAPSDDQKLHLATTPADFAALGLGRTIAVREAAGRRSPRTHSSGGISTA